MINIEQNYSRMRGVYLNWKGGEKQGREETEGDIGRCGGKNKGMFRWRNEAIVGRAHGACGKAGREKGNSHSTGTGQ